MKLKDDGQCDVSCTCKDFKYRWERALADKGSAKIIRSNGERALKTNPNDVASLCKHVYSASTRLLSHEVRRLARRAKRGKR